MGPMPPIIAVTTWASLYFMLGPVALPLGPVFSFGIMWFFATIFGIEIGKFGSKGGTEGRSGRASAA